MLRIMHHQSSFKPLLLLLLTIDDEQDECDDADRCRYESNHNIKQKVFHDLDIVSGEQRTKLYFVVIYFYDMIVMKKNWLYIRSGALLAMLCQPLSIS